MRHVAVLAVAALSASCDPGSRNTITVGGAEVAVPQLVRAHGALCQAAAEPESARRIFFDHAHEQLHTVAQALEDVDRAQAAELLQAKEKVESGLPDPPASLVDDIRRLAGVYRDGLGRLAITAPPCDK